MIQIFLLLTVSVFLVLKKAIIVVIRASILKARFHIRACKYMGSILCSWTWETII